MSLRTWINTLKESVSARLSRLRKGGDSSSDAGLGTDEGEVPAPRAGNAKFQALAARFKAAAQATGSALKGVASKFPSGRVKTFFAKAKDGAMKSDSVRLLVEKIQSASRQRWENFRASLPQNFPRRLEDLKNVQPQEFAEGISKVFRQGNLSTYLRVSAVALVAWFLADTASLFTDALIPDAPPIPPLTFRPKAEKRRGVDEYASIMTRNLFNSSGFIPDDLRTADPNGPARKTNLPLNLVGTVVLADEGKSISAIEDKGSQKIYPLRINDSMDGKITIKKIEHLKVTFVNNSNGGLEYVEIQEDQLNRLNVTPSAVSKGGPIEKEGETHFNVQKTEIDKAFANLNQVLTQARAIPSFENGVPNGFKIIQIVPDSIYSKLGIKEGDTLTSVNGEPMNDPGKAFQLLNELKSGSGHLELTLKGPDGTPRTQTYDMR